jgi:integrase
MASIFKKTYTRPVPEGARIVNNRKGESVARWTNARGRQRSAPVTADGKSVVLEYARWSIAYFDHTGARVTVKGYRDRAATESRALELERAAERRRSGVVDYDEQMAGRPLADCVEDWLADLRRQGRCGKYVYYCSRALEKLRVECNWHSLASIRSDRLSRWLCAPEQAHLSGRTLNYYLETARCFIRWCCAHSPPWLPGDPLAGIKPADESKPRAEKRAFSPDELARLREHSRWRWDVYLTAALTGLRHIELKRLQWQDVHLDGPTPHLALRAVATKARRADNVPLHPEVVSVLTRLRPQGACPTDKVFKRMPKRKTFKKDVTERAKIPWRDELGRLASFHALRKTFGTSLALAGVPMRTAMELMRVTNAGLLTGIYNDAHLLNGAAAVALLPGLQKPGEGTPPAQ